ncbi:unnamed protein product [Amoebophrya sp. A25]|nr:unnamed protein product [Amoebophrya sp. A25]|eukprot:GSA25T00023862001.1
MAEHVCRLVKQQYALDALPGEVNIAANSSPVTVGRTNENTLCTVDKTISKNHCSLELHFTRSPSLGNQLRKLLFLKDNSSFGSYINEVKLGKEAPLTLIPHQANVAFRRPKAQDDGGYYRGDYVVHYSSNNIPKGDELLCDEQGNVIGPVNIVGSIAPQQDMQSLRPYSNLMPQEQQNWPDILIPVNMAGLVVGKGGETIKRIGEQSGTRLDVSKDRQDCDANGMKKVHVIEGNAETVEIARKMINDLVEENRATYQMNKDGGMKGGPMMVGPDGAPLGGKIGDNMGMGGKDMKGNPMMMGKGKPGMKKGDTMMKGGSMGKTNQPLTPREGAELIITNAGMVGLIIGASGKTVNRIKADTMTEIEIGLAPDGNPEMRAVQISGDPANIARAKQMIEDLLKEREEKNNLMKGAGKKKGPGGKMSPGGGPIDGAPPGPLETFETEVPSDVVGLLIGHRGDTIRRIQNETGCKVEVDKSRGTPGVSQMVIFEAPERAMIEAGVAAMNEILRPVIEARAGQSGGPQATSLQNETAAAMQQGAEHAITHNPEDNLWYCHFNLTDGKQIDLIIGNEGATIRRLGEESKTDISIVRIGGEGEAAEHTCIIKGATEEEVTKARTLVQEVLNEHMPPPAPMMAAPDASGMPIGPPDGKHGGGKKGGKPDASKGKGGKGGGKKGPEEKRKLYIDEMNFPRRRVDQIHPEEMEVFISGMRSDIDEECVWKCLCAVGASDVAEILLLKDQDRGDISKGMAYVLFSNQAHAMTATQKLSMRPLHAGVNDIATDQLKCVWSESERVLRGSNGSHREELIGKLMGKKAVRMQEIQQAIGANRAILTGRGMKGYGTTDECTRLHLVLCIQPGTGIEMMEKAKPVWEEQLTYAYQDGYNGGRDQQPFRPPGVQNPGGVFIPPTAVGAPPVGTPPGVAQQQPVTTFIQPPGGGPPQQVIVMPAGGGGPPPQQQILAQGGGGPPQQVIVGAPPLGGPGAPLPTDPASGQVIAAPPGAVVQQPQVVQQQPVVVPAVAQPVLKIPLVLKRVNSDTGKKYCEAVALVGSELRWQAWCPEVGGEGWKAYALRWGKEGQLFVILQQRESGQIKLCVVEENLPMERWKTVVAPPVELFSAKNCMFKPFNIDGKSYLACLDRARKKILMYKIRDPNEAWETCYEEPLRIESNPNSMRFSHCAKIHFFYCPATRRPYAIVHDRSEDKRFYNVPELYEISSAREQWRKVECESEHGFKMPLPQTKFRMWPVYMRTNAGGPATGPDGAPIGGAQAATIEVFLFVMDVEHKELLIIYIPREGVCNEWHIVARKSFAADTRLSLLYIAGKPEPMCMSLSSQSGQACLFKVHLHLVVPPPGMSAKDRPPPQRAILEELFRRDINDLLKGHPAYSDESMKHQLIPVDTSADLACSQAHPWISQIIKESALPKNLAAAHVEPTPGHSIPLTRGPFGDTKESKNSAESPFEQDGGGGGNSNNAGGAENSAARGAAALPVSKNHMGPFDSSPFGEDDDDSSDAGQGPFDNVEPKKKRDIPFDDGLLFHLGDKVEANWRRKGNWYPARIVGVSTQGNGFTLEYEATGELEYDVWEQHIQPLSLRLSSYANWRGPKDTITVRAERIGLIIGSKGGTVKELEREFQVKVAISRDEGERKEIFILAETAKRVKECRDRIQRIIRDAQAKDDNEKRRQESIQEQRRREAEEWERQKRRRSRDRDVPKGEDHHNDQRGGGDNFGDSRGGAGNSNHYGGSRGDGGSYRNEHGGGGSRGDRDGGGRGGNGEYGGGNSYGAGGYGGRGGGHRGGGSRGWGGKDDNYRGQEVRGREQRGGDHRGDRADRGGDRGDIRGGDRGDIRGGDRGEIRGGDRGERGDRSGNNQERQEARRYQDRDEQWERDAKRRRQDPPTDERPRVVLNKRQRSRSR